MPLTAGHVDVVVTARTAAYNAGMAAAEARARRFNVAASRNVAGVSSALGGLGKSAKSAAAAFGFLGAAVTGALAIRAGIHAFASFEATMNNVRAVSGATGSQFSLLNEKAKQLGATTKFTATEVAEAMSFMAMAGLNTSQIYDGVATTMTLAAAGNMELGQAADIVTNIMTSLNLKTEDLTRAVDVLTKTFTSSNTSLGDLGYAFKYVAPIANAAGLQFEEISAALGLLGNAGMQGTLAGTALRGAIIRLLNPSKEARKALKLASITVTDLKGRMLPLVDILKQFEPHVKNVQLFAEVFGQRAGPGMVNLVSQGSEALEKFTATLRASGGTAQRIAETQMEGLRGSFVEMKAAAEGLAVALGESGLGKALEYISDKAAGAFRAMTEGLENMQALNVQSADVLARSREAVEGQLAAINTAIEEQRRRMEGGSYFGAIGEYFQTNNLKALENTKKFVETQLEQIREYEQLQRRLRAPVYTPPRAAAPVTDEDAFTLPGGFDSGVAKQQAALAALQRLQSEYLQVTKQTAKAIQYEHDIELKKFQEMLDQKLISQEQFEEARQQLAVITEKKLEALHQKSNKMFQEIGQAVQSNLESALRSFIETGKIDFHELTKSILADLAVIALRMALMGLAGGQGGLGNIFASLFHSGGTAGAGSPRREVPAAMFVGAPRLHNGGRILGRDEVPAILKRGETVSPPAKKEGGVTVQIVNNTKGDVRQETARGPNGHEIRRFIIEETNRAITDGRFDGTMRTRYGSRALGTRR